MLGIFPQYKQRLWKLRPMVKIRLCHELHFPSRIKEIFLIVIVHFQLLLKNSPLIHVFQLYIHALTLKASAKTNFLIGESRLELLFL